ncbi:hypothetical protein [Bordetella avium]|uniref:Lipoprotein n=1 Tax=Bordetella avium (strain 197N) TaxID=360910 RepID=Q2KVM8_BORA1|nr:hypothetical protein [Bordetella avium]AZY53598.1 hypothetical protein C0J07_14770 [Bordetella avium]RIQ16245.1 hypothetical protein D0850_15825 [Bordetella avium]RIQ30953.1 hypothetical protein D0849_15545 [Bordetella avium]RIQ47591.1 hypothetical protein D0843_17055 [Bordetella avium]RIQ68376.1 hypothetical protein D0838_16125 [Bordetella avium]
MRTATLIRYAGLMLLFASMTGCTVSGPTGAVRALLPSLGGSGASNASVECRINRNACLYNGAYEPGERDYAEQEAKRLNAAELNRLRSNAIR